ncbi:MAG TPA: hypothetical protein VHM89_01125 [Acidimicrobiales bacterium]|nr:hypothetical protein [Acidimicrobiales bacterium]
MTGAIAARRRLERLLPWVVGVVAFALELTLANVLQADSPDEWKATVSAVVAPANDALSGANAYEYDTLTREQILPTFAAIVADHRFRDEAAQLIGLPEEWRDDLDIGVEPAAGSALVSVSVRSTSRVVSERMADATLRRASSYIASLGTIYRLQALPRPAGSHARREKTSDVRRTMGLAGVSGLSAGVLIHLFRRRAWARPAPSGRATVAQAMGG